MTQKIDTRVATITPDLAKAWLEKNTINRPLRRSVVDGIRRSYERGEYRLTHQGIAFADTGELLDGQHRLTAIAQMPRGFAVNMMITVGLPSATFDAIDQGLKRSHSDVLRIEAGHAAVARTLAVIHDTARSGITSQYLVPFVEGSRIPYTKLIDFCPKNQKVWSSANIRAAAVLRMLAGGDQDYICMAYYSLVHMEFDSMTPVVQTLFRQVTTNGANVSSKSLDLFSRAFKAFDVRRSSDDKIQINDTARIAAQAREIITLYVLGNKKAPVNAGAKKVNGANSTPAKAVAGR